MASAGIAPNSGLAFEHLVDLLYGGAIAPAISRLLWESVLQGHTALPLSRLEPAQEQAVVCAISSSPNGMLQVEGEYLYLARFRAMEMRIASRLLALAAGEVGAPPASALTTLTSLQPAPNSQQKQAIDQALRSQLLLLTGGPGTGKSFTLRAIVQAARQVSPELRIAALAPTASAAQRLAQVGADFVGTVHKALGISPGLKLSGVAGAVNLPFDLVIVDEATMLSAQLADTLLNALRPSARLILAGDRYQLASVEAGAIFSQACSLTCVLVALQENWRFINYPELATFSQRLVQHDSSAIQVLEAAEPFRRRNYAANDIVHEALHEYEALLHQAELASNTACYGELAQAMHAFRLIVATNEGPFGLDQLSGQLEELLRIRAQVSRQAVWFVGRLIVILRNDAASGLRNGQTGVCVRRNGELHVFFDEGQCLEVARLPPHRSAWAITVHKAQGNEYERVLFILPQASSPLAMRELLYTAATRARRSLGLVGDNESLLACASQHAARDGGLRWRLRDFAQ